MGNQQSLSQAVDSEDYEQIRRSLLAADTTDNEVREALIGECILGNTKLVELITQCREIDLNSIINGFSPLMWVSSRGNSDIVKILLRTGAKVDLQLENGRSALTIASQNGHARFHTEGGTLWNFPSPAKVFPLQKNIFPLQRQIFPLQRKCPSSLPHTKTRFPYPTATPSTILFLRVKYDICLFSQHLQSLLKVRE